MEVKIPSNERAASTAVPNSVVIRLKFPPPRPAEQPCPGSLVGGGAPEQDSGHYSPLTSSAFSSIAAFDSWSSHPMYWALGVMSLTESDSAIHPTVVFPPHAKHGGAVAKSQSLSFRPFGLLTFGLVS